MFMIGSRPISCDGEEALRAVAHGLAKSAKRPVDFDSLKVRIRRANGDVLELSSGDVLELSANVATPKQPAKREKPKAPPKAPPKSST